MWRRSRRARLQSPASRATALPPQPSKTARDEARFDRCRYDPGLYPHPQPKDRVMVEMYQDDKNVWRIRLVDWPGKRRDEASSSPRAGFLLQPICSGESLQESSPNRVPANLPRSARIQLEKSRSPPRPLRPLRGSGGTAFALRLVTCWSSDALGSSSSGRIGQKIVALAIVVRWPAAHE